MFIVRNPAGAHLIVLGPATILITSPAMLAKHTAIGLKVVACDETQFKKYEDLRVDV